MPLSKAVLAAFKVASRLTPDIRASYKVQRVAEDVAGSIGLRDPRVSVREASCAAPDGYDVPLRVFTPRDFDFSLADGLTVTPDYRGTVLFFHGGGWANGDIDFYQDACTRMALQLGRRVVAVDYRRAPEHPFPGPAEDCYAVARALFAGDLLPDVRPDRVVLFGDSAGGNLAAVVSLMARDRGEFAPPAQVLLYPATWHDHTPASRFDSVRENGTDYLLLARDVESYMHMYAPHPADRLNPYCSPLLAPDLSGQPRTLVVTAEYDPLRDEGEAFAARLAHAGDEVSCYRVLNAIHGYLLYPTVLDMVRTTYQVIRHFLDGDELAQREGEPAWLRLTGK